MDECLEGFIILAEKMEEADLNNSSYLKFIEILSENLNYISQSSLLVKVGKFADIYSVKNE
jgi:hypothetical protein